MKFQGLNKLVLPRPLASYDAHDQAQTRAALERAIRSIPVAGSGRFIDANDSRYSLSGLGEARDGARLQAALSDAIAGPKILKLPAGTFICDAATGIGYYGKDDGSFVTQYFGFGLSSYTGEITIIGEPGRTVLYMPSATMGGQTVKAALGFINVPKLKLSGIRIECYGSLAGNGLLLAADDPVYGSGTMDDVVLRDITTHMTMNAGIAVIGVTRGFADNIFIDGTVKSVHDKEAHGWIFDSYQELEADESVQNATGPAQYWNIGLLRTRNIQGAGLISQGGADYTVQTLDDEWVQRFLNDRHTSGYYATRVGNGSRRAWYDMITTRGRSRAVRFNSTGFAHYNTLRAQDMEEVSVRWIGGEDTLANSVEPGQGFSAGQTTLFESNKSLLTTAKIFLYGSITSGSNLITDLSTTLDASPGTATPRDPGHSDIGWTFYDSSIPTVKPAWLSIGGFDPTVAVYMDGYADSTGTRHGSIHYLATYPSDPAYSLRVVDVAGAAVNATLTRARNTSTAMNIYETGVRISGNNQTSSANEPAFIVEGGTGHSVGDVLLYTTTERVQNVVRVKAGGTSEVIRLLSLDPSRIRAIGKLTGATVYLDDPEMLHQSAFTVTPGKTGASRWQAFAEAPYSRPTLKAKPSNTVTVVCDKPGAGYAVRGLIDFTDASSVRVLTIDGSGGGLTADLAIKGKASTIKANGICLSQSLGGGGPWNASINGSFGSPAIMGTSQIVRIGTAMDESAAGNNTRFTVTGLGFPPNAVNIIKNLHSVAPVLGVDQPIVDKYGAMNGTSTTGGVAWLGYTSTLLLSSSANESGLTCHVHGTSDGVTAIDEVAAIPATAGTQVETTLEYLTISAVTANKASNGKLQVGASEKLTESFVPATASGGATTRGFYQVTAVSTNKATAGNFTVGTNGDVSFAKQSNSHAGAGSEGGAGIVAKFTRTLSNQDGAILADQGGTIWIGAEKNGAETDNLGVSATGIGFYAANPIAQQAITGALSAVTDANAKAVLTSLVTALGPTKLNLVGNSTT